MTQKSETNDLDGLFTQSDFRLLVALHNTGQVYLSWQELMDQIYFERKMPGNPLASFKVAVFKLRKKLGKSLIESSYGTGHRLNQRIDLRQLILEIGKEFPDDLSRIPVRQPAS